MKKCRKCEIEKPLSEFYKKNTSRDGRRSQCKSCESLSKKQYHAKNREKINAQCAMYRTKNKEKITEYKKQYHAKNREKILEYHTQYRAHNKEKIAEQKAEYYIENKEKIAEQGAKYRAHNKEKIAQYYARRKSEQPNCVYQIKNTINDRVYIGETTRGELRWKQHLKRLRGNYHTNKLLQEDFDKFGEEAFEWTTLKEFESEDKDILLLEEARSIQQHIDEGVELYNLVLTIEQLKMLMEDK